MCLQNRTAGKRKKRQSRMGFMTREPLGEQLEQKELRDKKREFSENMSWTVLISYFRMQFVFD